MIVVFGSINMDLVFRVDALPEPGETCSGGVFLHVPGGKGANQAVALARARVASQVSFFGVCGNDANGDDMLAALSLDGIDVTGVRRVDEPTGTAGIFVAHGGENMIVVADGANAQTRADQVPDSILRPETYVVCQLETPLDETQKMIRWAKQRGARVILNAAPAYHLPDNVLSCVDVLIVNEGEAKMLARAQGQVSEQELIQRLQEKTSGDVIMTLGARGALLCCRSSEECQTIPSFPIQAVDATAAGDTFVGYCVCGLYEGMNLKDAALLGAAAGALACTKPGAQSSIPHRTDVEQFMRTHAL